MDEYGIDWDGPFPPLDEVEDTAIIEVPTTQYPISDHSFQVLETRVDPLKEGNSYGIDIYMEALSLVLSLD